MRALASIGPALLLGVVIGCGGGDGYAGGTEGGTTPTPPPSTTPEPNTISLTSAGASPKDITLTGAGKVVFMSADTVQHEIASLPHGAHTDCPMLNGGVLAPGASFTAIFPATPMVCGYH